eukprot:EC794911.1.p2 GENE.EC794911.1~~EC794911.1.p2  ORF type:complete len:152 (+),score=35.08 EC794911.1:88-543(+)
MLSGKKENDGDTRVILRKLFFFFLAFYAVAYALSGILAGAFRITYRGSLPFEHRVGFGNSEEIAAWLNLLLEFLIGVVLYYYIVRSARRAWDYTLTLGLFHFVLSCIVTLDGPTSWLWWITFVLSCACIWVFGELACHYLRDQREITLDRP